MADRAAIAQGFMLEHEGPALFAVTFRAGFVEAGKHQRSLVAMDFAAMRIMALHTIHFIFQDRMMMREPELGVRLDMAGETSGGVLARINDQARPSLTGGDVFAAGPVAHFTTGSTGELGMIHMHPRMDAGRECFKNRRVTFQARLVSNESGVRNRGRNRPGR